MRTHGTAVTLTGLLSLALVAGCSGGEQTGSPTGPATPSVTAAPAPAEPTTATSSAAPGTADEEAEETDSGSSTGDVPGEPGTGGPTHEQPTVTGPAGPTDPGPGADPGEDDPPGGDPTTDPPAEGLAVPEGSGCTPGDGPLPDGQWYGEVSGADAAGVRFDLMCFFLGEQADRAALEDGEVMVPVPNGYYVRNTDPTLRTFDVAGGTQVLHYPTGDPGSARVVDYAEWARLVGNGEVLLLGVWLTVDDGAVVAVEEQWTP